MSRPSDDQLLELFTGSTGERIARLAAPAVAQRVPAAYRAAAASVARQAAGGWTYATTGSGFRMSAALREFQLASAFSEQCGRVFDPVTASRTPELRRAVGALGDAPAAIMSAFFHYFAAHEFIHVEQGLGSDQYVDSDYYMPVVMEADYVADVAGLVLVMHADVPELRDLSDFDRLILFIAIHISAMRSFAAPDADELDVYTFLRLAIWHLHFARFAKAGVLPPLDSPAFERSWIVTFPRLIGREDQSVGRALIARRAVDPQPAGSDVVVAYHGDDGLFRIHRAALTDPSRTRRLCEAVLAGDFDDVRVEYEELLVNNPALVPSPGGGRSANVEWAAGAVLDGVDRLQDLSASTDAGPAIAAIRSDLERLVAIVRLSGSWTDEVAGLAREAADALQELALSMLPTPLGGGVAPATLRRRTISLVDQLALAGSGLGQSSR